MKSIRWDGNPIAVGGCYSGISLEQYHGDLCVGPSASSSGFRTIYHKSPAHFFSASYLNPNQVEPDDAKPDKEWQVVGEAAHALLVGGVGSFRDRFTIRPEIAPDGTGRAWNGNNLKCKEWIVARHREGKVVLTEAQIETVKGMAISMSQHPLIAGGILDGDIERSLIWKDPETGIWIKSRPDAIPNDSGDVADLKTTRSVLMPDVVRTIGEYGYYQQAAVVADAMKAVFDIKMTSFTLIMVEKTRPWCVRVCPPMHQDDIERGRMQNRVALHTLANCLESGRWPGPDPGDDSGPRNLSLSIAQRERVDARLKIEGMI
jgi:hypothetical protein